VIGYLDTSALIPLLITEPSSSSCQRFWNDADTIAASRLGYVEAAAALAQARRLDRLTVQMHHNAIALLDELWAQFNVVEVDQAAVVRAATLAERFGLCGYDAVHCAAAKSIDDDELVAAAGDRELLSAWSESGLATYDTNAHR
jgi:predicted nucleic acid-binding protein